jgi:DNA-directed RNA polymerase beta subunit
MNLGQIFETVLGWAGEKLGMKFGTPIFDGAALTRSKINPLKLSCRALVKPTCLTVKRATVSTSKLRWV